MNVGSSLRIYEINTRLHRRRFADITESELVTLAKSGFDAIWLMGVWQVSEASMKISRIIESDYEGSPFAVPLYELSSELGGREEYEVLRKRVNSAGMAVILDFVSNHVALDSPWIDSNPEWFIRADCSVRPQSVSEYHLHRSGELIAFGRDPFFPPWVDTAQLDYTSTALRSHMIDVLKRIASLADGVRCDMAMLLMRDYIRRQWYPSLPDSIFEARMDREFWSEAITRVKSAHPGFLFIAEAYWSSEPSLIEMGFDYCYEKELYDGMVARDIQVIRGRLSRDPSALQKSLYFIENHDELRAANLFEPATNLAAVAMILALPGAVLIHEGQMSGKKERVPVQRVTPLIYEEPDRELEDSYLRLLKCTESEPFKSGEFVLLDAEQSGLVIFLRRKNESVVVYVGAASLSGVSLAEAAIDLTSAVCAPSGGVHIVTNLLTGETCVVTTHEGRFIVHIGRLVKAESKFCLFQIAAL